MNETLRRALVQARLTEEDMAVHLQVDPKTVRRWLEGRTPYLRHRWALSALLGLDEADLWPHLRTARSRPDEVRAIYPHSGGIPRNVWQEFFQSAQREIGILADNESSLADDQSILGILHGRAEAGVKLQICLPTPKSRRAERTLIRVHEALARRDQSGHVGKVDIRLHHMTLHNSIYRADADLIIVQCAFGIDTPAAPALHLRGVGSSGLAATYLESFHRLWADAEPFTKG